MTRKRFDSSPQFNVKEEGVLIQQVAGSSTNLLEVKAHNGATLMAVDYAGTMTSGASNTFTYLAATTSASLPANTTIGAVSPTELGYLDGVTSAIQTQLDSKLSTAVTSLTGTANQITVSASTGSVTLSIPSSPTLSGTVTAGGFSAVGTATLNRASATAWNAGANIRLQIDGTTYSTIGVNANSRVQFSGGLDIASATYVNAGNSSYIEFGPNTSWGSYLRVGSSAQLSGSNVAAVISTDGNIHLDAASGKTMYLNYYSSGSAVSVHGAISTTSTITTGGNINYTGSNLVWMGGGVWDEDGGWSGVGSPSGNRLLLRHPSSSAMYIISRAGGGINLRDTTGGGDYNFNSSRFDTGNRPIYINSTNAYYTYSNNNSGLPWHHGPTFVGYNGWSYYSNARARYEMGHRDNVAGGQIYAWCYGGLILGSPPDDGMANTATLTIAGSAAKSSGGSTWAIYSDQRVKDNIQAYTKGMAEIALLEPKSFVYNGKNKTAEGEKSVGLIAQDVVSIFPDTVRVVEADELDDVQDPLVMDVHEIHFALINAVKELNARIVELENANRP